MNNLLDSEVDWINNNQHLYHCEEHKNAVIGNITKRYVINELNNQIKSLKEKVLQNE